MKIVLVNPWVDTKYPQPPLGLAMIAAVLERQGHNMQIVDLPAENLNGKLFADFLLNENPDLVGLSLIHI